MAARRTKEWILAELRRRGRVTTADVTRRFGISRQTAAQHMRELEAAGKLVRVGTTRGSYYVAPSRAPRARAPLFRRRYPAAGLEEDRVFDEVRLALGLNRRLSEPGLRIAAYAFTEMLNNAIEHSRARHVRARAECAQGDFRFEVTDRGVGAFASLRRKFGLRNDFEAVEHLLKGKQTTDPARHTGQGVFFTSKAADRFVLESGSLVLTVDNRLDDVFVGEGRPRRGTRVRFQIRQRTKKNLKELFDAYSNDEFEFDRTQIRVRLSGGAAAHLSRSEARRLLTGLDAFRRITLDFRKVDAVGQGFADEIFRVFRSAHPEIEIEAIHMRPAVSFMVERARRGEALQ